MVLVAGFVPPIDTTERSTDTARISAYDAQMSISEHGNMALDERIRVRFPTGKRGIFRIFDTADPRRDGIDHPVRDVTVERNEQPEPFTWVDSASGTETIRIGQEAVFLDAGEHTYRIRSRTVDVLEPGDDGQVVWWWDVIGGGWQMPMDSTRVDVDLPAEPVSVECVMGEGDDTPCDTSLEGTRLTVATGPIDPFTPVTVRVAFAPGVLPEAPAGDSALVTIVLSVLAAALAAGLAVWLIRSTRESPPGFPVLFEPPPGVGPAVGVRVLEERHSADDLQATLYRLAEAGVLRLEGDDDHWTVHLVADLSVASIDPIGASVLRSLGLWHPGSTFTISKSASSGETVSKARSALRREVTSASRGYLRGSGHGVVAMVLGWLSVAGLVALVAAYVLADSGWRPWPLIAGLATFAFFSAGMMIDRGVLTKRTEVGRDVWSRAGGFARFLTTDSSESRFEAAKHLDWYPRYLPWALALGVADAWARRFESQGVELPVVPWIAWHGTGAFSAARMSDSFNSAITSATAAYAASQASSGGGGFSGGSGGGGGGGGSW